MDQNTNIVDECMSEFQGMSSDRFNLEGHCREIAQRIVPSHKNLFPGLNRTSSFVKGEKRNELVFDSTAAIALGRFSAILDSLLTPRSQTWHKITATDPELMKDRQARLWFETVNQILFTFRYAPKANFSAQNQATYQSIGAYGTGSLFIDALRNEPGVRYRNTHLGETYIAENHQGIIDKVIRYYPMSARQAFQKWGDKIPQDMKQKLDREPEYEYYFLHCVKPRKDYDNKRLDYRGMAYASYYLAYDQKVLLEEGGYSSFPYAISRYEQAPGECYGRGPAMHVLPSVKTLNEQKKTVLKQGQRTVDPVLLLADDGILDGFSLRPGALNTGGVTADGRPLVHALPVGNLSIAKEMMDEERTTINDAFLITLFQILVETPTMTATEVMERTKEKAFLLAPTIGRVQAEYLGPLIERELDILARQFLLPPMPQVLKEAGGQYHVEYVSPLTRSQRSEEAVGLMRTLEQGLNVINVTQDPSILDFIDFDIAMPEVADIQGMPLRWTKSVDAIAQLRQSRAQQQQEQKQVQAAPGAAAIMKAAGKVKPSPSGA